MTPLVVNADQATNVDRSLLGGKGASLFLMAALDLPVPPFFVLTTRAWREWHEAGRLTAAHIAAVDEMVDWLQWRTGRRLGVGPRPLLVSVRSTGVVSMPGMMDTILNLGLTPDAVGALCAEFPSLQTVADLITTFVDTATPVLAGGAAAPGTARDQLLDAIEGVFRSWDTERAQLYRRINRIPDDHGTAVVVQAMAFGNADERSGTGVLFTRDPVTGAAGLCGEWLPATQGEAIVSGRSTPVPLAALAERQPEVSEALHDAARLLEQEEGQAQDIEFTVDRGRLYLLQTRALKTGPLAACHIALALHDEGLISTPEVIHRLAAIDLDDLDCDTLAATDAEVLATGLGASPGIAHGTITREISKDPVGAPPPILIRPHTAPQDLPAIRQATALVTEHGGLTSHAAIVTRELRIPCVVGCGALDQLRDGQQVTVDGSTGTVYAGLLAIERSAPDSVHRARSLLTASAKAGTP